MFKPFWPDSASLSDGGGECIAGSELQTRVSALAAKLEAPVGAPPLALAGDNSPDWILADLAAAQAGRALVPVPGFFTSAQIVHVCAQAGIREVLLDGRCLPVEAVWPDAVAQPNHDPSRFMHALPAGTQKITFTSGTTGQPKGICLTWDEQMLTARALQACLSSLDVRVHLNLLPLAVLLENIAGVVAPLLMGAQVVTPRLSDVGLRGSSDFDPVVCLRAIGRAGAQSIILLPQMLQALVGALYADPALRPLAATLRFVAVGGAPVPAAVLSAARALGLPVYEGYGLTECASVVCLNTPGADLPGSVGVPLPGLTVGLSETGEVWVEGRSHAGVLGVEKTVSKAVTVPAENAVNNAGKLIDRSCCEPAEAVSNERIYTGDLGEWVEQDGKRFLRIVGRIKNVLITSFGRNVSPEWPERLLMDSGLFRQVVVGCNDQPHLQAVLVPARLDAAVPDSGKSGFDAAVALAISSANAALPDYARIGQWHVAHEPFSVANGLATPNGRPLRPLIAQRFSGAFQSTSTGG